MTESHVALRIHEAACELESLTSLLQVLVEFAETIGGRLDPAQAAKVAADLARIAFDCLAAIIARLAPIEALAA